MWTAHEQVQCQWREDNNNSNNNQPAITGIPAADAVRHSRASALAVAEFIVRVEVCTTATLRGGQLPGSIRPAGVTVKPIGTLQEHGEDDSVKFGLMTGSYQKNKSGGVLRKNVSDFSDEVNETTTAPSPAATGRCRHRRYAEQAATDALRLTATRITTTWTAVGLRKFGFTDGECSNWGNPQSEIYLESLRYFGGLSATAAFLRQTTAATSTA